MNKLEHLAAETGSWLLDHGWKLATAESCTGGWISTAITVIAGSSAWFDRGFVTYSDEAKQEMLGVTTATLSHHGAVSEAVVREMVAGALRHSHADLALAVSGVAGPGGGSAAKPVGTVCFAWGQRGCEIVVETRLFPGDREAVRRQTVEHALAQLAVRTGGEPD